MNLLYDSTNETNKIIKFASLYNDKFDINLPNALVMGKNLPLYNINNSNVLKTLIDENIVQTKDIQFHAFRGDNTPVDKEISHILNNINELPLEIASYLTDTKMNLVLKDIITEVHLDALNLYVVNESFKDTNEYYKRISSILAGIYYYSLLFVIINSIINKSPVISSNIALDYIVSTVYGKYTNKMDSLFLPNALSIFIPDFSDMSIDDILEFRYIASDELSELRHYIMDTGNKYDKDCNNLSDIDDYITKKINPAIKCFERKIKTSKIKVIQNAINSLKNPLSYVPLITTLFTNIPAHHSLLISLGLISANVALDFKKEELELKDNPLYFTVNLKKKLSSV